MKDEAGFPTVEASSPPFSSVQKAPEVENHLLPDDVLSQMRWEVSDRGYSHLEIPIESLSFERFVSKVGREISRDWQRAQPSYARLGPALPIPLHSPHPSADWVVYHGLVAPQPGGQITLLDTQCVLYRFSEEDLRALATVRPSFGSGYGAPLFERPFIQYREGKWDLFLPQRKPNLLSQEMQRLWERFERELDAAQRCELQSVFLKSGEILLADNRRMLQGRAPLPENNVFRAIRVFLQAR